MWTPPPYSRWREAKSLISRAVNVFFYRGTADMPLSARAHLEQMPIESRINSVFHFIRGEVGHCEEWAKVETHRALEVIERAEAVGILPAVRAAFEARSAGNG
jgi:hypothetical protein